MGIRKAETRIKEAATAQLDASFRDSTRKQMPAPDKGTPPPCAPPQKNQNEGRPGLVGVDRGGALAENLAEIDVGVARVDVQVLVGSHVHGRALGMCA